MIDFLTGYPLDYYIRNIIKPPKRPNKVACYLSRDSDLILIKTKGLITHWDPLLRDIPGAPSLECTQTQKTEGKDNLPSVYARVFQKETKINKNNETMFLIDDPDIVITSYTVSAHETAGELEASLSKDPGSVITSWKNYSHTAEFSWEILDSHCRILRDKMKLSKRVILCGFPEARAFYSAQWLQAHRQELTALAPIIPTFLSWALQMAPPAGCFLIITTPQEIAISYIQDQEIKVLTTQKTKEGFTADEVADIQELIEEVGVDKKDALIWTWGIPPNSAPMAKLISKFPNTKNLTPTELEKIQPLPLHAKLVEPIDLKEAWLLNHILS